MVGPIMSKKGQCAVDILDYSQSLPMTNGSVSMKNMKSHGSSVPDLRHNDQSDRLLPNLRKRRLRLPVPKRRRPPHLATSASSANGFTSS